MRGVIERREVIGSVFGFVMLNSANTEGFNKKLRREGGESLREKLSVCKIRV